MKVLESSIDIDSSPEQVWAVLTDFARFAEWNPFITSIEGSPIRGTRLAITIRPPGARAMNFKPTVTASDPTHHLAWLGRLGLPRLFDGAHEFTLLPNERGGTSFNQRETFSGLLVPFLAKTLVHTLEGFEQMNEAIKQRAEALAHTPH
jgi:hypothetical protein